MKELLFFFALAISLASCNNTGKEDSAVKDSNSSHKTAPAPLPGDDISGCYMRVLKRDTLVAHLQLQGDRVKGRLTFDNFEKDGSTGTVSGTIDRGIIKLIYSFQAEGTNSVMDVYFKKQGDALIRGTGEIQTRGDTAYFVNPAALSFDPEAKLSRVPCEDLHPKFR